MLPVFISHWSQYRSPLSWEHCWSNPMWNWDGIGKWLLPVPADGVSWGRDWWGSCRQLLGHPRTSPWHCGTTLLLLHGQWSFGLSWDEFLVNLYGKWCCSWGGNCSDSVLLHGQAPNVKTPVLHILVVLVPSDFEQLSINTWLTLTVV